MKNKKLLTIIIFTFFCVSIGFTQEKIIHGEVYSSSNDTIEIYDVIILNKSDSTVISGNTFFTPFFSVGSIKISDCLLKISSLGYEEEFIEINEFSGDSINIGKINLGETQIEEVIIKANRPIIKRQNGKLIVDVKNSSIKNAKDISDVLKKSPGVIIDKNKNILVIGKGQPLVYINDREILSNQELEILRPSDIDYIEIIRNPTAEYRASASSIIKIYTKKITHDVLNASLTNSSYYGERFSNISTINIKSKYKKITTSLSYTKQFWNYTDFEKYNENIFQNSNDIFENNGESNSDKSNNADKLLLNTNFDINEKHKISLQALYLNLFKKDSTNTIQRITDSNKYFERNVSKFNEGKKENRGIGISYFYNPDTLRKISLLFDYASYLHNDNSNIFENSLATSYSSDILLYNTSDYNVYSGKIDYSYKKNSIGYSLGGQFSSVDNTGNVNQFTDNILVENVSAVINDKVGGIYIQANKTFNNLYISAGTRFEYSESKNIIKENNDIKLDTNYHRFFPNILVNYEFNKNFITTFSASRKISRPTFKEINPRKIYYDSLSYFIGNPSIKPSFIDNFELGINIFEMLDVSFNYSLIKDKRFIVALDDNNIIKYTYINIDDYRELALNLDFAYYGNWYSLYASLGVSKPNATIPYLNESVKVDKPMAMISLTNEFMLGETTFYIDLYYDSPGNYGLTYYEDTYFASAGLYRSFFNDQLFILLSLSDIFKTENTKMTDNYSNIFLTAEGYQDSRRIELSIKYNFNKFKKLIKRNHSNDNILKRID